MAPRVAWKIFLVLLFSSFITYEAGSFQAPAVPSIARHFGIPMNLAAFILLLYYLGVTVFAPIMGRLADQVGRKRMLLFGLSLFSASEFMAALAPNFSVFLGARFLQGFGVACIMPGILAYVGHLFPPDRRGLALGVLTFSTNFGAATGGFVGGLLIDNFGWPSIYWISGAFALAGLLPVYWLVPEIPPTLSRGRFDLRGAAWLLITIGSLLSLPTWAARFGMTSPYALVALVGGVVGLFMLWRVENRAEAPVVDVSLLRTPAFALTGAVFWLLLVSISGVVYTLVFFISGRPGGSAAQVGIVSLCLNVGAMAAAPIAGRFVDRFDPRKLIIFALLGMLCAVGMFATVRVETPFSFILIMASLLGIMMGISVPAVLKVAVGAIPREKMGAGTGLFSMFRDLGSPAGTSFALAVFGSATVAHTQLAIKARTEALGIPADVGASLAAAAGNRETPAPRLLAELQAHGTQWDDLLRLAGQDGMSGALPVIGFLLLGVLTLSLFLAVLLARRPSEIKHEEVPGFTPH